MCSIRLESVAVHYQHVDFALWALAWSGCRIKTIEWYRKIQRSIADQKTIDGAEKLIANLEAKKAALYPEGKPAE